MDMLSSGHELGLATLKACVVEADKPKVEPLLQRLENEGRIIRVKRNRWLINGAD